jgi:hypothetical protein
MPFEIPERLKEQYVNVVRIAHSASELVFEFALLMPGGSQARVESRIIMSPLGAKLFFRALAENLSKYEATFGEIKAPGDASLAEFLFRPPTPPENPPQGTDNDG